MIINQQQNSTSLAHRPQHTTIYFVIIKSPTTSSPRKVIHKGMKFKTSNPIPLGIRAYDTRATPNYPSLPALAHKAAIPAEGVSSQDKGNI